MNKSNGVVRRRIRPLAVSFVVTKKDGSMWARFSMTDEPEAILARFADWCQQPGCQDCFVTAEGRTVLEYHAEEA